jgi:hypothetical protein
MIEVQSGPYLGEDDIVRFEDRYGRTELGQQQNENLRDRELKAR